MFDVNLYLETDLKAPRVKDGHYGIVLECKNKHGETKTITEAGCLEQTTGKRLVLAAVFQGLRKINKKSRITIYTDSAYLQGAFAREWMTGWKEKNWKNAKGQEVKNKDIWERILYLSEAHEISVLLAKEHIYTKWLQAELKKTDIKPGHCRELKPV